MLTLEKKCCSIRSFMFFRAKEESFRAFWLEIIEILRDVKRNFNVSSQIRRLKSRMRVQSGNNRCSLNTRAKLSIKYNWPCNINCRFNDNSLLKKVLANARLESFSVHVSHLPGSSFWDLCLLFALELDKQMGCVGQFVGFIVSRDLAHALSGFPGAGLI